jgi:hypothetical protein
MINFRIENAWKAVACLGPVAMSVGLCSCLPEPLEVNRLPVVRDEIVVSTQMISDRSLVVLLTHTIGALDANDDTDPEQLVNAIAVNDAFVTLDGPASTDTLDFVSHGIYMATGAPFEPGETYSLHIKSPGMREAMATTQVRRRIAFTDVDASLYYNGYDDTLAQVTYTIKDPEEQNWYLLNVQEVEREDLVENLLNPRSFTVLLADDAFNGKSFGERFVVFSREYKMGDTIAVSLSNISEDYYRFMQMRVNNRFGFLEFISEPVNYPSNVVGGRGYFNLYIPDVRFFILE